MTSTLPDLSHRGPDNEWLTELPERVTPDWIDQRYDELDAIVAGATDDDAWIEAVRCHNELTSHLSTVFSRARLRFRQDTADEEIAAEYRRVNGELAPVVSRRSFRFSQTLADSDAMPALEREFGEQFARELRTEVQLHDDRNIELRSRVLDVLMGQTNTFAHLQIEWRGELHPWSFARKAAHDPDHAERHAAFASQVGAVREHEQHLQEIFDEAGRLRLEMARNLGFSSYPQLRYLEMGRYDYGTAEVASFRDAIHRHVVPLSRKLRERQAQTLGTERLHPADQEIWPDPTPELAVSVDGQLDAAQRVLEQLGEAFARPFELMVREGLVDLPARPGKGAGAFCTGFDDQKVPFIFCNSVDSPDDVKTLLHEYGHALQYWRSSEIELVGLRHPSLEACEIHSMTLELLASPHVDGTFFEGEAADHYRGEHLRSTLLQVPYMAAIDEFQHGVYGDSEQLLSADGRAELWERTARRYLEGIDFEVEPWWTRNRWLMQLHVFHYPFYYIDYALARMVSWELWLDSLEDAASAHERYLALCSAGGTRTFRELLDHAGLGDPFDARTVERTMARLAPHLGL